MSAKPQTKFYMNLVSVVFVFLYLQLLLWSTLQRPAIDVDVQWVPQTFFSAVKQSICSIRLHPTASMTLFESAFFAIIAMAGYFPGNGYGLRGVIPRGIYGGTLVNFEASMMGVRQKYHWICFVPWIITFLRNWLENLGEFLVIFVGGVGPGCDSSNPIYEAHSFYSSMVVLMLYFSLQALMASEIVCMAWQGWCYNGKVKQRKQLLGCTDALDAIFGSMH